MNIRIPILLTILNILFAAALIQYVPTHYADVGALTGGVGSILAVIWFYSGLRIQSLQLLEQRKQFVSEFQQIREDGRRNALILSRDILNQTEKRVLGQNPKLQNISDLLPLYIQTFEFKSILESEDPDIVRQHVEMWLKKEGPAVILMKGIKSAAEIYFQATGIDNIDYSKPPEEFVFIYGPHLWKKPFFDIYESSATMLANFMITLQPGREAAMLASIVAAAYLAPRGVMKEDQIKKLIEEHRLKKYPLPKIVEKYLKSTIEL